MQSRLFNVPAFRGVSALPLLWAMPLFILCFSPHWAYDEATTYVMMHNNTTAELIAYKNFRLANHHLLNTLYMYWVNNIGLQSLFLFRLPSVLMFFIYYWAISSLLRSQPGYKLRHIDQLMLYSWPYFIFFAQARGYAVAMAAFVTALFLMKRYLQHGKPQHLFLFVVAGSVSSLAIFSFIIPFVAMMVVLGMSRFSRVIKSPLHIFILLLFLPALLYVFDKGQVVSKYDVSIIGRDSLLRGGTLSSLVSFLTLNEFAAKNVFLLFKVIFMASLLPVIYVVARRMKWYAELSVVAVSLVLLVIAHYLFGAQYPVYRGAAYIIMLLLLSLAYSNFKRNVFLTAHFAVIIFIGVYYVGSLLSFMPRKSMTEAMVTVTYSPGKVAVDDVNLTPTAINYMMQGGKLSIANSCADVDYRCFEEKLDDARYAICHQGRMEQSPLRNQFRPLFKVATFFDYNRVFYQRIEE